MSRMGYTATLGLLLASAVLACSPAEQEEPTLVLSALPDQDETLLREKYGLFAKYLGEKLGVPVEYHHANDYADLVELFANSEVQLAWFGGLSGVQARARVEGSRAIAQGVEDPNFYSYFIAHRDTGLEATDSFPMGLEGRSFAFGSRQSTSGRLMPEHFIREHTGKAPAELFGQEPLFTGSHDKTAELVESGGVQAGVLNYTVYDRRVKEGTTDPEVCRVIWKTPAYADYNFTAHPDLDRTFGAGFVQKVQDALLAIEDPRILEAFQRSGFIAARNEDFAAIEALAKELDFLH